MWVNIGPTSSGKRELGSGAVPLKRAWSAQRFAVLRRTGVAASRRGAKPIRSTQQAIYQLRMPTVEGRTLRVRFAEVEGGGVA